MDGSVFVGSVTDYDFRVRYASLLPAPLDLLLEGELIEHDEGTHITLEVSMTSPLLILTVLVAVAFLGWAFVSFLHGGSERGLKVLLEGVAATYGVFELDVFRSKRAIKEVVGRNSPEGSG